MVGVRPTAPKVGTRPPHDHGRRMHPPPRLRPTRHLIGLAILALTGSALAAPPFVADEREVCPASSRVYDPEFEPTTQQMVYYDGKGAVRVSPVLPDGRIGGRNCVGAVVARDATISLPDLPFKAGPEWAVSARGLEIVFTQLDSAGRPFMANAAAARRGWRVTALPETAERGLALVSSDAEDDGPRLVYAHVTGIGTYELAWREAWRPETESALPGEVDPRTGGAPRWVPGRRSLSLGLVDPTTGHKQAAMIDVDTRTVRFLTQDAGDKDEVWLWRAPEYDDELALMTVADGCCLRFYREIQGQWVMQRELRAQDLSSRPMIVSPELLVHGGHSYVVMQLGDSRLSGSDTWIAGVDPAVLAPIQISDPARPELARSEPEWHVTPDAVVVYVTASASRGRFALNLLRTPLAAGGRSGLR